MIVFAFATAAGAQSLADLARQERERKKNVESKITLTNDSVRPAPARAPAAQTPAATPSAVPPLSAPASAATEVKSDAKPDKAAAADKPVRDEKYWRGAFKQAREDLSRAETQVKAQELRLSQAHKDLLLRSDIYNKEQTVAAEINAANTALDAARVSVEQSKQKISALEEELRRSGGPAGWAR